MKIFVVLALVWNIGFFGGEVWATDNDVPNASSNALPLMGSAAPLNQPDNSYNTLESARLNRQWNNATWSQMNGTATNWGSSTGSAPWSANCNYDPNDGGTISSALKGCKPKGMIETKSGDYKFETDAKKRVIDIANQLILVGSLLAVWAIVYAGILYTIAAGDDERIKSAKNALKFGIIGFAVMLVSFGLVNAIVRLFYATGG